MNGVNAIFRPPSIFELISLRVYVLHRPSIMDQYLLTQPLDPVYAKTNGSVSKILISPDGSRKWEEKGLYPEG